MVITNNGFTFSLYVGPDCRSPTSSRRYPSDISTDVYLED